MKLSAPIFRLKSRAKSVARDTRVPLHVALDQVARNEGFRSWSHLSASISGHRPASGMLARLDPGDLLLLAGRPGHGKTLLGLELAIEAARRDRPAFFFTLVDNEDDVRDRLRRLGVDRAEIEGRLVLDTSDDICAQHIVDRVGRDATGALLVVDYLQLLDQRRRNPGLEDQIRALRSFARATGSIVVVLSQIDRSFESSGKDLPELADIRLPNPIDLTLFSKSCFMRNGDAHLQDLA